MEFKAHNFPEVYKDLGIDLRELGCIMVDTEPLPNFTINPDILYTSPDPNKFWIKGQVSQETPHVTLLYGLLPSVTRSHVDTVLDGQVPETVSIKGVGHFDSPYEDEEYYCLVAHVDVGDPSWEEKTLTEANERLSLLPHVKTFPGYKAHLTLAYVRKDAFGETYPLESLDSFKQELYRLLGKKQLAVTGLNYGHRIK